MSQNVQELASIVAKLTQRITDIETRLGIATRNNAERVAPIQRPAPQPRQEPSRAPRSDSFGGKFLGGVAVLCFVVAAGYFLRLAIESGWLTPLRQVLLAGVFGFTLIVTGLRLHRLDKGYGAILAAGGNTVLFLAVIFAHVFYRLIGAETCMALLLATSALSLYLFSILNHSFFIVTAIVGSYSAPHLLSHNFYGQVFSLGYLLVLDVLFCVLAIKSQVRRIIPIAAYFALFGVQIVSSWGAEDTISKSTWIVFDTLQFTIFTAATFWYSVSLRAPLSRLESWFLAPIPVIFYMLQHGRIELLAPQYLGVFGLLFGVAIIFAQLHAGRRLGVTLPESFGALGGVATAIVMHTWYHEVVPEALAPLTSVAFLLGVPWLSKILGKVADSWTIWLLVVIAVGSDYVALVDSQPMAAGPLGLSGYSALIGTLLITGGVLCDRQRFDGLVRGLFLAAGSYQLVLAGDRLASYLFPGVTVIASAFAALVALALMLIAYSKIDRVLARVSLLLFSITAYQFLFSDLAGATGTVRIIALLVVGSILYAGGFVLRKLESKAQSV
jgi:hypothetical protein